MSQSELQLTNIFSVDKDGKPTMKIVFFGPTMAGKTSMLTVFNALRRMEDPELIVSALTKIEGEFGRTVFFDHSVFQTPPFKGKKFDRLRYQLWTIPGEDRHKAQRDIVMRGVDAVLLFLNFEKTAWDLNVKTIKEAKTKIGEKFGKKIPVVAYINKSDLPAEQRTDKRAFIRFLQDIDAIPEENVANYIMTGSCLNARNDLLAIIKSENRDKYLENGRLKTTKRPDSVWLVVRPIQKLTQLVVQQRIDYLQNL
ncbi:MAG: hypothetical protein ACTSQE_06255 [Candidatus Heimdallarchaeaceae archaeon]